MSHLISCLTDYLVNHLNDIRASRGYENKAIY